MFGGTVALCVGGYGSYGEEVVEASRADEDDGRDG